MKNEDKANNMKLVIDTQWAIVKIAAMSGAALAFQPHSDDDDEGGDGNCDDDDSGKSCGVSVRVRTEDWLYGNEENGRASTRRRSEWWVDDWQVYVHL